MTTARRRHTIKWRDFAEVDRTGPQDSWDWTRRTAPSGQPSSAADVTFPVDKTFLK